MSTPASPSVQRPVNFVEKNVSMTEGDGIRAAILEALALCGRTGTMSLVMPELGERASTHLPIDLQPKFDLTNFGDKGCVLRDVLKEPGEPIAQQTAPAGVALARNTAGIAPHRPAGGSAA